MFCLKMSALVTLNTAGKSTLKYLLQLPKTYSYKMSQQLLKLASFLFG